MKKVYVVMGRGYIEGVYANEESAKKAAEHATWCAGCEGSNAIYGVYEEEVRED